MNAATTRFLSLFAALFAVLGLSSPAYAAATGLDYSSITGAIDVGTTVTAIMTVGGIVALVAVAVMGVRKVLRMIR
jgi:hypothetical protein